MNPTIFSYRPKTMHLSARCEEIAALLCTLPGSHAVEDVAAGVFIADGETHVYELVSSVQFVGHMMWYLTSLDNEISIAIMTEAKRKQMVQDLRNGLIDFSTAFRSNIEEIAQYMQAIEADEIALTDLSIGFLFARGYPATEIMYYVSSPEFTEMCEELSEKVFGK